ncbi:MAG TPA: hypothetical protein EYP90_06035, partial [Chromatiaceae bacterium]|nr:hypothetical protein [Chromatiaceae bacterium]
MSTEITSKSDLKTFHWDDGLSEQDYLLVTYRIDSLLDGEMTALGIAKEQSTVALHIQGIPFPADMESYMARIRGIRHLGPGEVSVPPYFLNTTVYTAQVMREKPQRFEIEIAYPLSIFVPRINLIWNTIFGEVPRLGFITGFQMTDVVLPDALVKEFPGPFFGVAGIRDRLQVDDRPIFCRSM